MHTTVQSCFAANNTYCSAPVLYNGSLISELSESNNLNCLIKQKEAITLRKHKTNL